MKRLSPEDDTGGTDEAETQEGWSTVCAPSSIHIREPAGLTEKGQSSASRVQPLRAFLKEEEEEG